MRNINELRQALCSLFDELKQGATDVKVASEMNNTAGKIIGTLKVQIDYAALRKEVPSIPYIDSKPE